jgi:predicted histidine transporter YuiF (NhaC family)
MIPVFLSSLVGSSIVGGALLGILYALLFIYEKKRQYTLTNSYSKKSMIYSSFSSSLFRALVTGGSMIWMIRSFNLIPSIVIAAFALSFLIMVVTISMNLYEY